MPKRTPITISPSATRQKQVNSVDEWVNKKEAKLKSFHFYLPLAMKKKLDIFLIGKGITRQAFFINAISNDLSLLGEIPTYPLPPKTRKVCINGVPGELHQKVKTFAVERDISMQDVFIYLIQENIAK